MSTALATIFAPRSLVRPYKPVDLLNEADDYACALYASLGFSTAMIAERTRLSPNQVQYRIKKAGLTKANGTSRSDFRNGTSPFAQLVVHSARKLADAELVRQLKANGV